MHLFNRIDSRELKKRLYEEPFKRKTISFYKYHQLEDPQAFRDNLYLKLNNLQVFGRIYIAAEGLNAQISVPEQHFDLFKEVLNEYPFLRGIRLNIAVDDDGKSFFMLKVKVRQKIVADGINDPDFDVTKTGTYLKAEDFNQLASKKDTIIVDMRNHYEYEVGHFKNALEVPSDTFREQLPMAKEILKGKEDKDIIMYCTGGIRCEKATAYLRYQGFKKVHHVEGGIINYVNQVKQKNLDNHFIGKNFVFDERLGERVTEDIIAICHQCGKSCDDHTNCKNSACHLLFIQCTECAEKYEGCCTEACREYIHLPEEKQREIRKGIDLGRNIFNKSREGRLRPKLPLVNNSPSPDSYWEGGVRGGNT